MGSSQVQKFDRSSSRQKAISRAILMMIIKDLRPLRIVECEGFRNLVAILEPRYRMVSRQHLQQTLLPKCMAEVEDAIMNALQDSEACSVTLDIWTSRRVHAYLGITCHFLTSSWNISSVLLSCSRILDSHTGENISSEFDQITKKFAISDKTTRAVTDNASNMVKAFADTVSLPGFATSADDEDLMIDESEEMEDDDSELEGAFTNLNLGLERISCFAHTLQLCVRDGLKSAASVTTVLSKAARVVTHIKKSKAATEKMEEVLGKTLISKNETQWNSQLKMVRRLLEVDLDKVSARTDLRFSSYEKAVLTEFVEVMEPFEEATNILQGDNYVSISLALPCVRGILKHLGDMKVRYCTQVVRGLQESVVKRLGDIEGDSLYITATALDPRFKLSWCEADKVDECKQKMVEAVVSVSPNGEDSAGELSSSQAPPALTPSPFKKSKLFAFMATATSVPKKKKTCAEEVEAYLREDVDQVDPLDFWRQNASLYPGLALLAKRLLAIPATSAPIERVFSEAGKILRTDRCRLLPRHLEMLLSLKVNAQFMS